MSAVIEEKTTAPSAAAPTKRITYMDAIVQAQIEEMQRDENVILFGQEISVYGSGEVERSFDKNRVRNTPISEGSTAGMAIGAAMTGLRPIMDLTISSFVYLASDQIINQAAKLRYMTGGQMQLPVVFRACMYYNMGNAAQHSDRPYTAFMNTPGLKVLLPATAADMKGLMKAAIRDNDPVLIFEDAALWTLKEEVPTDPDFIVPIGKAAVKQEGTDVTLISIGGALPASLKAAKKLAKEGISVEVVDPRTLVPLDKETLLRSVAKTGKVVVVDNAHITGSAASEVAAVIAQEAFSSLKAPVVRVATPDVQIPFSAALEKGLYPTAEKIMAAIQSIHSIQSTKEGSPDE